MAAMGAPPRWYSGRLNLARVEADMNRHLISKFAIVTVISIESAFALPPGNRPRLADPRFHVFTSRYYPGDPTDAHPTADQHAAMARDLEPDIRAAVGW